MLSSSSIRPRRPRAGIALVAAAALGLTACGGEEPGEQDPTSSSSAPSSPATSGGDETGSGPEESPATGESGDSGRPPGRGRGVRGGRAAPREWWYLRVPESWPCK